MKNANDNKTEFEMWRQRQVERQAYVLGRRLDRARFKAAQLILEQVVDPLDNHSVV